MGEQTFVLGYPKYNQGSLLGQGSNGSQVIKYAGPSLASSIHCGRGTKQHIEEAGLAR